MPVPDRVRLARDAYRPYVSGDRSIVSVGTAPLHTVLSTGLKVAQNGSTGANLMNRGKALRVDFCHG
jgi:hypothetical protein